MGTTLVPISPGYFYREYLLFSSKQLRDKRIIRILSRIFAKKISSFFSDRIIYLADGRNSADVCIYMYDDF